MVAEHGCLKRKDAEATEFRYLRITGPLVPNEPYCLVCLETGGQSNKAGFSSALVVIVMLEHAASPPRRRWPDHDASRCPLSRWAS
jgi:hypothetical protein